MFNFNVFMHIKDARLFELCLCDKDKTKNMSAIQRHNTIALHHNMSAQYKQILKYVRHTHTTTYQYIFNYS